VKEVLLHIGMNKTGSSSIQYSLKGYHDKLSTYANFPDINHSLPMSAIFSSQRDTIHWWKMIGLSDSDKELESNRYLSMLEKMLENAKSERLIISGEGISKLADSDKEKLVNFFKKRGLNVKVFCFLRDPISLATSMVQQRIKGSALAKLCPINPQYRLRLEQFSKILPPENLIVKDFKKTIAEYGDIVSGFASLVGLDKQQISCSYENTSLSETATRLIYTFNKLPIVSTGSKKKVQTRHKLANLLRNNFPVTDDDKLDKRILSKLICSKVEDEINYVSDNFGINFHGKLATTDIPSCDAYLSELSKFEHGRLADILRSYRIDVSGNHSAGEMLTLLYNKLLYTAQDKEPTKKDTMPMWKHLVKKYFFKADKKNGT
jgi:hypothetical protein